MGDVMLIRCGVICRDVTVARSAPYHGDAARPDDFQNAVRTQAIHKSIEFVFTSGNFDHDVIGSDVDDAGAEDVEKLPYFATLSAC